MPTALANTVNPHDFGRDPLFIALTDDSQVSAGGGARRTINFLTGTSAGDVINIVCEAVTITFTCATTPDSSGLQFAPGATNILAATAFEAALLANFDWTAAFTITRTGPDITATARFVGTAYNFTAFCTPGGINTLTVDLMGSEPDVLANYRLGLRIWQPYLGVQQTPVELSAEGDGSTAEFDIHSVIHDGTRRATWPSRALANGEYCALNVIAWYAEAFEMYGTPPVRTKLVPIGSEAALFYAWWATMRFEERAGTQAFLDECTGDSSKKHPFLTWRGRGGKHTVTRTEQHVLGWFYWEGSTIPYDEITVRARVVTKETPTPTAWTTRYVNTGFLLEGAIGMFGVGWTELNMDALVPVGETPIRYDVYLSGSSIAEVLSEQKSFYLVDDDTNDLFLEFDNSLGIVETLRCSGGWVLGAEAEHELLQRTLGRLPLESDTARIQEPLGTQRTLQVSTRWMPRTELYAVLDILHAKEVKHFDVERNMLLGATINKGAARIVESGGRDENLFALNLELLVGDKTHAFSLPHLI